MAKDWLGGQWELLSFFVTFSDRVIRRQSYTTDPNLVWNLCRHANEDLIMFRKSANAILHEIWRGRDLLTPPFHLRNSQYVVKSYVSENFSRPYRGFLV